MTTLQNSRTLKRNRDGSSENEDQGQRQAKRRLITCQGPEPAKVSTLVSSRARRLFSDSAATISIPKSSREIPVIEAQLKTTTKATSRKVNVRSPKSQNPTLSTASASADIDASSGREGGEPAATPSEQPAKPITAFEKARRVYAHFGTEGVDEAGLSGDDLRAFLYVRKLAQKKCETPEGAQKRMAKRINELSQHRALSTKDTRRGRGTSWLQPTSLDARLATEEVDNARFDSQHHWNEEDEAATEEREPTNISTHQARKNPRRQTWTAALYATAAAMDESSRKQVELIATHTGREWEERQRRMKENPGWYEEELKKEAMQKEEVRKRRQAMKDMNRSKHVKEMVQSLQLRKMAEMLFP